MPDPSGRARPRLVAPAAEPAASPEALLAEVAKGSEDSFERLYPVLAGETLKLYGYLHMQNLAPRFGAFENVARVNQPAICERRCPLPCTPAQQPARRTRC